MNLVADRSDRDSENPGRMRTAAMMTGQGVQQKLALDLLNRVADKPGHDFIGQAIETFGDGRSKHTYLQAQLAELTRKDIPFPAKNAAPVWLMKGKHRLGGG